jgi:hypothetical protein
MTVRRWKLGIVCVALLGATAAFAAASDDAAVGIDFRKSLTLGPQETLAQSKDYTKKMHDVARRISQLETKARKDKDVVKLNCVADKAAQVRGHLVVNDQSMNALNEAITRNDDGARQHEFTRVTILYQKVLILGTEAEQCIGEDVSYVGATRVDVEIDPSIPQEDPTTPPLPVLVVDRPPEASPFV